MRASSGCAAERALCPLRPLSTLTESVSPRPTPLHSHCTSPGSRCISSQLNSSSASSHHRTLASIHITTYYTFTLYIPRSLFLASHQVWSTHTHRALVSVFLAFLSHTLLVALSPLSAQRSGTIIFSFADLQGSERSSETPIVLSATCVQCSPIECLKLARDGASGIIMFGNFLPGAWHTLGF